MRHRSRSGGLPPFISTLDRLKAEWLKDSPAGLWLMRDTGTVMTDTSGNARNGTHGASALEVRGPLDSVPARGSYSGAVRSTVPDDNAWTSTAFSVLTWWQLTGTLANGFLIAKNTGSGSSAQEWDFQIRGTGAILGLLRTTSQGTYRSATSTVTTYGDGKWHLLGFTTDGTALALYADGEALAQTTAGPTGTRAGNTSSLLSIGNNGAGTGGNQPSVGNHGPTAFYGSQLSAARMFALYEACQGG